MTNGSWCFIKNGVVYVINDGAVYTCDDLLTTVSIILEPDYLQNEVREEKNDLRRQIATLSLARSVLNEDPAAIRNNTGRSSGNIYLT